MIVCGLTIETCRMLTFKHEHISCFEVGTAAPAAALQVPCHNQYEQIHRPALKASKPQRLLCSISKRAAQSDASV